MKKNIWVSVLVLLVLSVIYTVLVKYVGVEAVGPLGSSVGFAKINQAVFETLGENRICDLLSEALMLGSIGTAFMFAVKGAVELYRKKSLKKVDRRLLMMGGVFLGVIATYFLFEKLIINYRPVTPDGVLEASYPSSHTMVTMTIFGCTSVWVQSFRKYNRNIALMWKCLAVLAMILRLFSGMHWLTDIIGGCLFSLFFVTLYRALITD